MNMSEIKYTGPERRWMKSREWSDWTARMALHDVVWAAKEARELATLTKLHQRALDKFKRDESDALWSAIWLLRKSLRERQEAIARECAAWFDASAFPKSGSASDLGLSAGDDCPKCGGELTASIHRYQDGPGNYPDCSWLSCLDCDYRTDPE